MYCTVYIYLYNKLFGLTKKLRELLFLSFSSSITASLFRMVIPLWLVDYLEINSTDCDARQCIVFGAFPKGGSSESLDPSILNDNLMQVG